MRISPDFLANLKATIARFNEFARNGKDLDFHRGERGVDLLFNGNVKEEPGRKSATMWPISDQGPYYAALVTGGTLDTKGGPKTNSRRTGAGSQRQTDSRTLRRRQLRGFCVRAGLLGGWQHAGADHRVCLSRRQPGQQGTGARLTASRPAEPPRAAMLAAAWHIDDDWVERPIDR